ncbi:MAG: PEP-CTERM sorting domain-containing protein, partial [Planctomycetota bacterium]|nr:PEP-CTERM sorting domain-containing protein [Planctomycetota bacterium]
TTGPTATGFLSLGFGGKIGFNLTSAISNANPIYLYIGEVGDNGEVAAGNITVSDVVTTVPVPAAGMMGLVTMGVAAAAGAFRRRKA